MNHGHSLADSGDLNRYNFRQGPQSILLVDPSLSQSYALLPQLVSHLLCQRALDLPCQSCAECQRVTEGYHPDWIDIQSENHRIKLESIRELSQQIMLTPQRSQHVVVTIRGAEYLNESAGNALLKILEEPPAHVYFLLWTQDSTLVLPTLKSRCIMFYLKTQQPQSYEEIAASLILSEPKRQLIDALPEICLAWSGFLKGERLVKPLADQLNQYPLDDVLWFIALIASEILTGHLTRRPFKKPELLTLSKYLEVFVLFDLLDRVNQLRSLLKDNINLNSLLVIETLCASSMINGINEETK